MRSAKWALPLVAVVTAMAWLALFVPSLGTGFLSDDYLDLEHEFGLSSLSSWGGGDSGQPQ